MQEHTFWNRLECFPAKNVLKMQQTMWIQDLAMGDIF